MTTKEAIPVVTELDLIRYETLSSSLFFTRYFFKKQYNRKFIIAKHHSLISAALDRVLKGECRRLIINISPRYGKTELAVKSFIANGLALNAAAKFIHLSYSSDLALDNSETVKDLVQTPEYQELFPQVQVKKDSRAKDKWYTTAGGGVLARAAGGQVTGFGAGKVDEEGIEEETEEESDEEAIQAIDEFLSDFEARTGFAGAICIDDPLKPEDAESELARNKVNKRFDSTIVNRVNSRNTPIIIIMQRLHENDLCGHVLENYKGEWEVLSIPCIQEDEQGNEFALWPHKETLEELQAMRERDPVNFQRQKQQDPQPREGYLYGKFKTYEGIPASKKRIRKAYIDTADQGADHLCSITYIETEAAMYVTDVLYTRKPMEFTEPATAQQLTDTGTDTAKIESNNGGRGFARNVETQLRLLKNFKTKVEWFHQSGNKISRIFTNATSVTNLIYMPEGWERKWPDFHKHVTNYLASGKNKHDDAEDTLTGMVEDFGKTNQMQSNFL